MEYWYLLTDPAHWLFELTSDILLGVILYPLIKKVLEHIDKHK